VIAMLGPRIVIIGNSGSGKSTLARSLAARAGGDVIDLDHVHWLGRVGSMRDEGQAKAIVAGFAATLRRTIESVYGWLAEVALPFATSSGASDRAPRSPNLWERAGSFRPTRMRSLLNRYRRPTRGCVNAGCAQFGFSAIDRE